MKLRIFLFVFLFLFLLTGCLRLPDINVKVDMSDETRQSVEQLNERIKEFNRNGVTLSPEMQRLVVNLTNEIEAFNQTGIFGKEGVEKLAVINNLIKIVDEFAKNGVKVGLDQPTLQMVDTVADIIKEQPAQWGEQSRALVRALELTGTDLSQQIASDLSKLTTQITADMRGLGAEARCSIDHAGDVIPRTMNEAGSSFLAGILPFLGKPDSKQQNLTKIPGVCTISPNQLHLEWRESKLVAREDSQQVEISGFNFSRDLPPRISVQAEDGTIYPGIQLTYTYESSYRITVNLQGKTFISVTNGAKLVFVWSDIVPDAIFEKSLFIGSAPVAIANFAVSTTTGDAPLVVQFFNDSSGQPDYYSWDFGDKSLISSDKNPSHLYEKPGTYTPTLTVANQFSPRSTHSKTITVTAPILKAAFEATPRTGIAPLTVSFHDQSLGTPNEWLWDFGDGSFDTQAQSPLHEYKTPGLYPVTLTVRDKFDSKDTHTKLEYVVVEAPPTPPPPTPTPMPTPVNRTVRVTGNLYLSDDESWPASDEDVMISFDQPFVLSEFGEREQTYYNNFCVGGEVRLELNIRVILKTPDGSVLVDGTANYYEGTECDTDDFHRGEPFNIEVTPNASEPILVTLSDGEGGIEVNLMVTNNP